MHHADHLTHDLLPRPDGLVWHYTNGGGLLSILRSHTLWATSSAFLNDRQEVRLGAELIVQRLRRLAAVSDQDWVRELTDRMSESGAQGDLPSGSHFFILSASQSSDSLAMWRLYGGQQESYAIGLDPEASLGILAVDGSRSDVAATTARAASGLVLRRMPWTPVQYEPERQRTLVDELVRRLPDQLGTLRRDPPEVAPDGELPAQIDDLLEDLTETLLLIKHEGFIDERETRLAVISWTLPGTDDVAAEAKLLRYRASAYGITPYLALTGVGSEEHIVTTEPGTLPIRALAISPSPNGSEAHESVRRLLATSGYGDVPVLGSSIPFRAG